MFNHSTQSEIDWFAWLSRYPEDARLPPEYQAEVQRSMAYQFFLINRRLDDLGRTMRHDVLKAVAWVVRLWTRSTGRHRSHYDSGP